VNVKTILKCFLVYESGQTDSSECMYVCVYYLMTLSVVEII
jgi:hypothetical protein